MTRTSGSGSTRSGGLRRKLLRSYLNLAGFGLLLLVTSLVAISWLRESANTLTTERTPAVEAALLARAGVQRSLAGLRGWVALGEPKFREARRAAWAEEIAPAMLRIESLSQGWGDPDREHLAELQPLLAELKESQWWVEDVAQTDGNERAHVTLSQEIEPISRTILLAVRAMLDTWQDDPSEDARDAPPSELSVFHVAQLDGDHQLENFVFHGEPWSESGFRQSLDTTRRTVEQMASNSDVLRNKREQQLEILQQELPWYSHFAAAAVAARKSEDWNVAQYLMRTETVPLSEQVMARLNALSDSQIELMRRETATVDRLGSGAVLMSLGLILVMAVFAVLTSRHRARQITQPLASLSEATEKLAAGRLTGDLPVTTDDELGSLTQSFNQMRVALRKSEASLRKSFESLAIEHERAESLLLNILPSPIAERLKQDDAGIIADSFSDVTVLFADLVDFTEYSGRVPPEQLVQSLNEVFSRFDTLADTYGLEKIKTIGDAYMVVSGLPTPRADHAEAGADMALAMIDEIAALNVVASTSFQIRVGMHSGPAVAGVIGHKKFTYDIWGDTVNVASRMESRGVEGAIQVSEHCYQRLRGRYVFEDRGLISVKGKGAMRTYLLTGRAPGRGRQQPV